MRRILADGSRPRTRDPLQPQMPIGAAIHSVDKDQAISDARTVDKIRDRLVPARRAMSVDPIVALRFE